VLLDLDDGVIGRVSGEDVHGLKKRGRGVGGKKVIEGIGRRSDGKILGSWELGCKSGRRRGGGVLRRKNGSTKNGAS